MSDQACSHDHSRDNHTTLNLGGVTIQCRTGDQVADTLGKALDSSQQQLLFFANTNFIVKCQHLIDEAEQANSLIVNDGIGLDIAAWLVHRQRFPANLNGTDFIPYFLQRHRASSRVFLLGGEPGIAGRAAAALANDCETSIAGFANGFADMQDTGNLIRTINQSGANVLLVAMGNPLQEAWILKHRTELNCSVIIGVGALLDFLAGAKPRAPAWVRRYRLEWLYRLSLEPRRLLRRYSIDILIFLNLCRRHRHLERRQSL